MSRTSGVAGDNTPYSVDFGLVNRSTAADVYKKAAGQKPSELLKDPTSGRYFVKRTHKTNGHILSFATPVLEYLLGHTHVQPGTTK
jgi:hypothetical protein